MKRFLVETLSTATETNPSFAGEKRLYYTGKQGKNICHSEEEIKNLVPLEKRKYFYIPTIIEYGYTKKIYAEKAIMKEIERDKEDKYKFWENSYKVYEVEIKGDEGK